MKIRLKKLTLKALLCCVAVSAPVIADDWGYIVADHYECQNDHMLINTDSGWLLAEAYSPYSALKEGALIYGDLRGYGFETIQIYSSRYDDTATRGRIYIDNYWMSDEDAAEYCYLGIDK